jgi:hypothetical protein
VRADPPVKIDSHCLDSGAKQLLDLRWSFDLEGMTKEGGAKPWEIQTCDVHSDLKLADGYAHGRDRKNTIEKVPKSMAS